MNKYNLIFIGDNEKIYPHFINQKLKTIDEFTKNFADLEDMLTILSYLNNLKLINAIITNSDKKNKTYPIAYNKDNFDDVKLYQKYFEYVNQNQGCIRKNNLRFINIPSIKDFVDGKISHLSESTIKYAINCLFKSYYHRRYAYFELIDHCYKQPIPTFHIPYELASSPSINSDPYIQRLLNEGDYDTIATIYDLSELSTSGNFIFDGVPRKLTHD